MSYKFSIYFALTIIAVAAEAQSKEEKIKVIRQSFQAINQDRSLTKITLSAEEFLSDTPDNGGELSGYFKNDTLCKIIVIVGPSYGMVQHEYYFSGGRPFFIYETEKCFPMDDSGSLDYTRLKLNFEGRYYLDKDAVIDIRLKGEPRFAEKITTAYIRQQMAYGLEYSKLLYKTQKKGK